MILRTSASSVGCRSPFRLSVVSAGKSRPYSFIMQVDCSAVLSDGRLGMFPDNGVLYVFLELYWGWKRAMKTRTV